VVPRQAMAFVAALTAVYSTVSIRLHLRFHSAGYDLGIFEQAIRAYAGLRAPIVDLKGPGVNLLGDHFHPILVVLAPFYAVFPSPITLLVAQAFLFALAAAPLVVWAQRALGGVAATAVGLIYGLSFGIASAVGFDFHEIAFAVPLIAFSLAALGQDRLRAASLWALPLVLVKEDLGITVVAVVGFLLVLRGARRLGILTAAFGIAASIVEVTVLLPAFAAGGGYAYWSKLSSGPSIITVALTSLDTLLLTVAITGFAALFSPLALAAVPTLLWRFLGNDANYWGTDYHYSAVLMPIMVAAMVDAVVRWRRRPGRLGRWAAPMVLSTALAVSAVAFPFQALGQLFGPTLWQPNPQSAAIESALARIPDGVTVSASDNLVPQLTARDTLTLFGVSPLARIRPQWIIVDPESPRHYRVTRAAEQRDLRLAEGGGYAVAFRKGDITLLRRLQ
jgi:uncharacterized membrane protein